LLSQSKTMSMTSRADPNFQRVNKNQKENKGLEFSKENIRKLVYI